jgi:hypothetical protein
MRRAAAIVLGVLCAVTLVVQAQAGLAGKWQGRTMNGRPITLDTTVKAKAVTGTLTVGDGSAPLVEGKADEKTMSFTVTLEGRTVGITARLVGDALEMTVEGVQDPVTLTRAK